MATVHKLISRHYTHDILNPHVANHSQHTPSIVYKLILAALME